MASFKIQAFDIVIATRNIQEEIKVDLRNQNTTLQQVQLNNVLSVKWLQDLPSSGESLEYCFSLQQRKKINTKLSAKEALAMKTWASEQKSSIMIIHSKSASTTKDVLLDLVKLIRGTSHPILWALRYPNYWATSITCVDILRMLVLQALQINPSSTCSACPITVAHMREAVGQEDWAKLLGRALDGIPDVYVVIDADLFAFVTRQDKNCAIDFLDLLRKFTTKTFVKVFVSSANVDEDHVQRKWTLDQWSKLKLEDVVVSPSQEPRRRGNQRRPTRMNRGRGRR